MNTAVNSKLIKSYNVDKFDSGIIQLIINTPNKSVCCRRYSDNHFELSDCVSLSLEDLKTEEINNLKTSGMAYLCYNMQVKDQIHFLWIPVPLITNNQNIKDIINERVKQRKIEEDIMF